eukprot:PhM_4_TR10950/c0_g1_i1/m.17678
MCDFAEADALALSLCHPDHHQMMMMATSTTIFDDDVFNDNTTGRALQTLSVNDPDQLRNIAKLYASMDHTFAVFDAQRADAMLDLETRHEKEVTALVAEVDEGTADMSLLQQLVRQHQEEIDAVEQQWHARASDMHRSLRCDFARFVQTVVSNNNNNNWNESDDADVFGVETSSTMSRRSSMASSTPRSRAATVVSSSNRSGILLPMTSSPMPVPVPGSSSMVDWLREDHIPLKRFKFKNSQRPKTSARQHDPATADVVIEFSPIEHLEGTVLSFTGGGRLTSDAESDALRVHHLRRLVLGTTSALFVFIPNELFARGWYARDMSVLTPYMPQSLLISNPEMIFESWTEQMMRVPRPSDNNNNNTAAGGYFFTRHSNTWGCHFHYLVTCECLKEAVSHALALGVDTILLKPLAPPHDDPKLFANIVRVFEEVQMQSGGKPPLPAVPPLVVDSLHKRSSSSISSGTMGWTIRAFVSSSTYKGLGSSNSVEDSEVVSSTTSTSSLTTATQTAAVATLPESELIHVRTCVVASPTAKN